MKSAILVCTRREHNKGLKTRHRTPCLLLVDAFSSRSPTQTNTPFVVFHRLARAGQLFHTALTVPLYFTSAAGGGVNTINGLWEQQQLMGVVVIYFRGPRKAASASALVRYASAVARSAAAMSELMVHRARFVVGRAHRIKRSWRVLVIALRFAMPMLVRYMLLQGGVAREEGGGYRGGVVRISWWIFGVVRTPSPPAPYVSALLTQIVTLLFHAPPPPIDPSDRRVNCFPPLEDTTS